MRLLPGPILEAKSQGHKLYAESQSILAAAQRRGRLHAEEFAAKASAYLGSSCHLGKSAKLRDWLDDIPGAG